MAQWQTKLRAALPEQLRNFISRDARRELIGQVNATLLVFNDLLVHLEANTQRSVAGDSEQSSTPAVVAASDLAKAAASVLQRDNASVMLLLPPSEFVATSKHMPGVTRDNLTAAIALQQDSLLPALDMPLAMGINPESTTLGDDHIALWISQERLDELFNAFADVGLFLAAVKPRPLAVTLSDIEARLDDSDTNTQSSVAVNKQVITQWLHIHKSDLNTPAFAEQWEQEIKSHPAAKSIALNTPENYCEQTIQNSVNASLAYSFFPGAALQDVHQAEQGRRLVAGGIAAVVLVVLAAVPFLWQSIEFRRAAATLAENRELSADARADQAIVANFENEWGPVIDYPQQNVNETLFTLQEVLAPEQLTSFELSEGLISIEGTSADPQAILQRLEQDPLFTEVVFARATNNSRYFIDLRLNPVNFEGYMLRYFPDN